jgi:hypothetical protein
MRPLFEKGNCQLQAGRRAWIRIRSARQGPVVTGRSAMYLMRANYLSNSRSEIPFRAWASV